MSFRVLSAHGADRAAWTAVLDRFPAELRDLHYLPQYGAIYQTAYGYEPLLAVLISDRCAIVHAFVRRRLDALAFLAEQGATGFTDVATPYGFGGPLLSDPGAADAIGLLHEFDTQYRQWCCAQGVAAEFVCLHPLLGNHAWMAESGIAPIAPAKEVVVIDLQRPPQALWGDLSRGTRSSVQRARRSGIEVRQVEPDAETLAVFQRLYLQTMQRRQAQARWFYPDSYIPSCVRHMGPEGSALFFASYDGAPAAAYLLLFDARSAYYHIGASDERWLHLRPNNLLMYETIQWARIRGLTRYHLGGGVSSAENDSLLRFKSSYGGRRATLYTYGRILNHAVYDRLCELKREHERRTAATIPHPDYFPLYRR
jgi:hypothetical protein